MLLPPNGGIPKSTLSKRDLCVIKISILWKVGLFLPSIYIHVGKGHCILPAKGNNRSEERVLPCEKRQCCYSAPVSNRNNRSRLKLHSICNLSEFVQSILLQFPGHWKRRSHQHTTRASGYLRAAALRAKLTKVRQSSQAGYRPVPLSDVGSPPRDEQKYLYKHSILGVIQYIEIMPVAPASHTLPRESRLHPQTLSRSHPVYSSTTLGEA